MCYKFKIWYVNHGICWYCSSEPSVGQSLSLNSMRKVWFYCWCHCILRITASNRNTTNKTGAFKFGFVNVQRVRTHNDNVSLTQLPFSSLQKQ